MEIIDTFPPFEIYWAHAQGQPIEFQIEQWASVYMRPWPELLEKQANNYRDQKIDWKGVARERVFPFLPQRLNSMRKAHACLPGICRRLYECVQKPFDYPGDLSFVIYVGIGCGAGWATTYAGSPAILLGLENIAEESWEEPEILKGLVAHELGHIVHFHLREQHRLAAGTGPWWDLYEEGFAQRCEHLLLGKESWHMSRGADASGWLEWCRQNTSLLASAYLHTVAKGEPVNRFFGSWFEVNGHKQTGYYLGHEAIQRLEAHLPIQEIALLTDVETSIRPVLESLIPRNQPSEA